MREDAAVALKIHVSNAVTKKNKKIIGITTKLHSEEEEEYVGSI